MNNPKVSILIPAYKPDFLEFTLRSALGQLYRPLEIIVSDDCPGEEILEICERHPDVKYYRNLDEPFYGNVRNLLARSDGEIIKILCDDDLLDPFCVARMSEVLSQNPGVKVVTSVRWLIDENNLLIKKDGLDVKGNTLINGNEAIAFSATMCWNYIGEFSTYAFRYADYEASGVDFTMFGETQLLGLTDVGLALNLLRGGKLFYFKDPLSCFRQHRNQSTQLVKPQFIRSITGWQDLIEEARRLHYMDDQHYQNALAKLITVYESFRKYDLFPELDQRIQELKNLPGTRTNTAEG
jgi:glycosyltransferase involved in cell wall biosynthesis